MTGTPEQHAGPLADLIADMVLVSRAEWDALVERAALADQDRWEARHWREFGLRAHQHYYLCPTEPYGDGLGLEREIVRRLKAAAVAVSGARDWAHTAEQHVEHDELTRRRVQPHPFKAAVA
jgi:hypothetical protein